MVNYEKRAFAGGLMISKIDPSTNSVTIYNNNPSTTSGADNDMSLAGIEIYKDGGTTPVCSFSGGIEYQATKTINDCSLNDDDGIYMSDANPSNSQVYAASGYQFIIDAVCWNDDGSTIDDICESGEEMVKAGVWGAGSAIDGSGSSFIYQLATNGNNDEAVNDWEAIPEFGTLLMPIASVILIVGYNYRSKKTEK